MSTARVIALSGLAALLLLLGATPAVACHPEPLDGPGVGHEGCGNTGGSGEAGGEVTQGGTGDASAPLITFLRSSRSVCMRRSRYCRRPGLALRFGLSETSTVTVTILAVRRRAPDPLVQQLELGVRTGTSGLRLRMPGLRAGLYRVTLRARDGAANRSRAVRRRFRVKHARRG